MSFLESRLPAVPGYGAQGGPEFSVTVTTLQNGYELRNLNWASGRRQYHITVGPRAQAEVEAVLNFFDVVGGKSTAFRFKDYADFKSCAPSASVTAVDQAIGVGDGSNKIFQLTKTRVVGSSSRVRTIHKPVSGSVVVALDGAVQASGWSVDTTTGLVTFVAAPASGVVVSAGFEFDVPVRFDIDTLPVDIVDKNILSTSFVLIEVRV